MLLNYNPHSISSVPSGTLPPCPFRRVVTLLSGELPVLEWPHNIHHSNRIIVAECKAICKVTCHFSSSGRQEVLDRFLKNTLFWLWQGCFKKSQAQKSTQSQVVLFWHGVVLSQWHTVCCLIWWVMLEAWLLVRWQKHKPGSAYPWQASQNIFRQTR